MWVELQDDRRERKRQKRQAKMLEQTPQEVPNEATTPTTPEGDAPEHHPTPQQVSVAVKTSDRKKLPVVGSVRCQRCLMFVPSMMMKSHKAACQPGDYHNFQLKQLKVTKVAEPQLEEVRAGVETMEKQETTECVMGVPSPDGDDLSPRPSPSDSDSDKGETNRISNGSILAPQSYNPPLVCADNSAELAASGGEVRGSNARTDVAGSPDLEDWLEAEDGAGTLKPIAAPPTAGNMTRWKISVEDMKPKSGGPVEQATVPPADTVESPKKEDSEREDHDQAETPKKRKKKIKSGSGSGEMKEKKSCAIM